MNRIPFHTVSAYRTLIILSLLLSLPSLTFGERTPLPQTYLEPSTGMELVLVNGGCYKMGCDEWMQLEFCKSNTIPPHEVCVNPFWVGKFEVTQTQWEKVMGNNPSEYKGSPDNPVETVSWKDIQIFLTKLNAMSDDSLHFRLPTEAEWEYAARSGGKLERYAGGNSEQDGLWHTFDRDTFHKQGIQSWPVGQMRPNGLDLYDMSGNVSEWTSDLYRKNYATDTPVVDPRGNLRVFRGGDYSEGYRRKLTTWRKGLLEYKKGYDIGFRLAADTK